MKTARRPPRPRKALSPSGEKLHARLALVEQVQRLWARKTFIFLPRAGAPRGGLPEGEGPQRGDLCILFKPVCEAGETLESFLDWERRRAAEAPPVLRALPRATVKPAPREAA